MTGGAVDLVVHPATGRLEGSVPVVADKSLGHRGLLFGALARGTSRVRGGGFGDDNRSTLGCLRALGVAVDETPEGLVVHGGGLHGLRAPSVPLDCGNSGTTMRLLCGILVAQPFASELVGDASLSRRPMERVARPLRHRGGRIEGRIDPKRVGEITAPLRIEGLPAGQHLAELEYELPVASAQVKSAILLSGLWAAGPTRLREPLVSRDHTERMLAALGVPLRTVGAMVELDGPSWSGELPSFEVTVPGDVSAAAFLVAAGLLVPGSRVDVRRVGVNPTRTGFLDVVRDMGGALEVAPLGDELGEPLGDLRVAGSSLVAARVGGEIVARAVDEVPVLCALAARAHGTTVVADAQELRVKESDRLAAMAAVLRAFGVECEERPDGIVVEGRPEGALRAAEVDSRGDHRIAMTAAVLGLLADGPSRIRDVACIATSFPKFAGTLRALGARLEIGAGA